MVDMMLNDKRMNIFTRIAVLDFETEDTIVELTGRFINGTFNIGSSSPVRRSGNFTLAFDLGEFTVEDLDSYLAIDKKIKIFFIKESENDIDVSKQGIFIITQVNSSHTVSSYQVSMQFADKMLLLNGTAGGTFPATMVLHEKIIIDGEDNTTIKYPLIKDIIYELVNHIGGEKLSRIHIFDIPTDGRQVVRWMGDTPIRFSEDMSSFTISNEATFSNERIFTKGTDVGYLETPLTFPGELVMKPGSTIMQALEEIAKVLGGFEFFYDVDGNFIFRKIQSFEMSGITTVKPTTLTDHDPFNRHDRISDKNKYFPLFRESTIMNMFNNANSVISVSVNPQYANIKNDFVVWGSRSEKRENPTYVRYHLAIDTIPKELPSGSLCSQNIYQLRDPKTKEIRQYCFCNEGETPDASIVGDSTGGNVVWSKPTIDKKFNWREELYRQALKSWNDSTGEGMNPYGPELIAEWRNIYDPNSTKFKKEWEDYFGTAATSPKWDGYNPDVVLAPQRIKYWLDMIDTGSSIGRYSVQRIGRRTVSKDNNKINEVLVHEVPDIVFIDTNAEQYKNDETLVAAKILEYLKIGQKVCRIKNDQVPFFQFRDSHGTCYEEVRDLFLRHMLYNTQVNIQAVPVFTGVDVNKMINLHFQDLRLNGSYLITSVSYNFATTGVTMNIQAHEAVVIV